MSDPFAPSPPAIPQPRRSEVKAFRNSLRRGQSLNSLARRLFWFRLFHPPSKAVLENCVHGFFICNSLYGDSIMSFR